MNTTKRVFRQIRVKASSPDSADLWKGRRLDDSAYDVLISGEDVEAIREDGSVLFRYVAGAVPGDVCQAAYAALYGAATKTFNRGVAAGGGFDEGDEVNSHQIGKISGMKYYPVKKDGTVSNTQYAPAVNSGIVGYFDRSQRVPFCRQTAWTTNFPQLFAQAMPYFRVCNTTFRDYMPERYEAQMEVIRRTSPDFRIEDTAFTTVSVNRNFSTAVHKDAGDLAAGFGVMSYIRQGEYDGCYFVFPRYRVAINPNSGDVILGDVHEWHGNTPFRAGKVGLYNRINMVLYYRELMRYCGSATEEEALAKQRVAGVAATPEKGKLRKAKADDYKWLARTFRDCAEGFAFDPDAAFHAWLDGIPGERFDVVPAVAWAHYAKADGTTYLYSLGVGSGYRRKGVASSILRRIGGPIVAEVLRTNAAAAALLVGLGFQNVGANDANDIWHAANLD